MDSGAGNAYTSLLHLFNYWLIGMVDIVCTLFLKKKKIDYRNIVEIELKTELRNSKETI